MAEIDMQQLQAIVGWFVTLSLITIVSFGFLLGKPIMKLVTTLTLLKKSIEDMLEDHNELRCENKEEHRRIKESLMDHEGRIVKVENKLENF